MNRPSVLASVVVVLVGVAGCSNAVAPLVPDGAPGDGPAGDGPPGDGDGAAGDAPPDIPGIPAPPVLGAQLDRRGRPMIREALIGVFAPTEAIKAAARDIYDQAPEPATWTTTTLRTNVTVLDELAANLAVFDAIDSGLPTQAGTLQGCGNALQFSGHPGAYRAAARLFGDDQVYVDTWFASCSFYFDLEIEFVQTAMVHSTCGGRTPIHDVVDVTYSVLAGGTQALLSGFRGAIGDGVAAHTDVTATFPFLGPPH